MRILMHILVVLFCCLGALVLPSKASNQLMQHVTKIENYIMNGYEEGWNHCDLISDSLQDPRDTLCHRFLGKQ